MKANKFAKWSCFAAAILLMVAAFIPLLKGEPMNVAFFGPAVVFFILTSALTRKARASRGAPSK